MHGTHVTLLLFKPYGVLSQFSRGGKWRSLADLGGLPPSVRPAGRLDAESEGLLLLTSDPHILHRLTTPRFGHSRTYLVQVEGVPKEEALERLRRGVLLEGRTTLPAAVRRLDGDPDLPPRPVPIRFRKSVPTSWLELSLTEGRNRQVRRMTAAVGHPALRLVRTAIGPLQAGTLRPGEVRVLTPDEHAALLAVLGSRPAVQTRKRLPGHPGRRSPRPR